MPAYAKKLVTKCYEHKCTKDATHDVFDTWNTPYGKYCEKHANEKVKSMNEKS